jgi:hypothetical protein
MKDKNCFFFFLCSYTHTGRNGSQVVVGLETIQVEGSQLPTGGLGFNLALLLLFFRPFFFWVLGPAGVGSCLEGGGGLLLASTFRFERLLKISSELG